MVADVPVGCLLSGGVDSSLIVGLLAEAGQNGLSTFSIGFESVGGVKGDEFKYSDIVADRFGTDHHQIRIGTDRMLPAPRRRDRRDERADGQPRLRRLLPAQPGSRQTRQGGAVRSGRRRGVRRAITGIPRWANPPPHRSTVRWQPTAPRSSTATPPACMRWSTSGYVADERPERSVRHRALRPRRAPQSGVDRALRLDTTVMLVDDPVKRVDNMTMAWGLEGRVPFLDHDLVELAATCPPDLKTAHGGKGVLKEAARRVIPSEVIDRPKGYFPVPALTHLEGPYLDLVRDALYAPVAKERGPVPPRGGRRAARRPQRSADAVARQRAVADRAARTVAADSTASTGSAA